MIRIKVVSPIVLFAVAIANSLASSSQAQVASYSPKVGQPHADFILPSIDDGKPLQLSSLRGKKVLLMHFASW